jgi:hypothetical protein
MNLLLKLSIDLIEHVETKEMVANCDLVSFVQNGFCKELAVNQCSIC